MPKRVKKVKVQWNSPYGGPQHQVFTNFKDANFFAKLLKNKGRKVKVSEV